MKVWVIGIALTTAASATIIAPDPLSSVNNIQDDLSSTLSSVRIALASAQGGPNGDRDATFPAGLLSVAEVARASQLDQWSFTQPSATIFDGRTGYFLAGTWGLPPGHTRVAYLAEKPGLPDQSLFQQEGVDDTVILQQSIEQSDMDSLQGL